MLTRTLHYRLDKAPADNGFQLAAKFIDHLKSAHPALTVNDRQYRNVSQTTLAIAVNVTFDETRGDPVYSHTLNVNGREIKVVRSSPAQ